MKIEYRKGNLLDTDASYLLHGCNCQGMMGSGVAKAIRSRYPKAYRDYREEYEHKGLPLGCVVPSHQPDGKTVFSDLTQDYYGTEKVHASYYAIGSVFYQMNHYLPHGANLAMPMVGAGLAGGDWNVISAIIENVSETYCPIVYQL